MVLSEGKSTPSLVNSHFMAEIPIWAKASDSSRLLVATMSCLLRSLVLVGLLTGDLDLSLYQSKSPVRYRFSHLKNHGFERFNPAHIILGDSPLTYITIACLRICSSIWQAPFITRFFGAYHKGMCHIELTMS
jgi:hypothetical protein